MTSRRHAGSYGWFGLCTVFTKYFLNFSHVSNSAVAWGLMSSKLPINTRLFKSSSLMVAVYGAIFSVGIPNCLLVNLNSNLARFLKDLCISIASIERRVGVHIGVDRTRCAFFGTEPAAFDIPGTSWSAIARRTADNWWYASGSWSGDCGCCKLLVRIEDDEGYPRSERFVVKLPQRESAALFIRLTQECLWVVV